MNKNEAIFWGVILLIFAPSVLLGLFLYFVPYAIIIGIAVVIYKGGKNGVVAVCGLISFTSLVQVFLVLIKEGTEFYIKIETAITLVSLATIETMVDLIIFSESINWNTWDHMFASIGFGAIAFIVHRI